MTPAPPNRQLFFLSNADGLYTIARFAFFARLATPMFRLAHQAIEYYLKAYLVDDTDTEQSLQRLKGLGHRLVPLYAAYKEAANPSVDHSAVVGYLDNFERLRYPRDEKFRMRAWDRPFAELFREFPTASERSSILWFHLDEFDEIVATIRQSVGSYPVLTASDDQTEYLYRENALFLR